MCLLTQIVNPTTYPGWNDLLLSNSSSCFFHTSNWARVLANTYNYSSEYFLLKDREQLLSLIPIMVIRYPKFRTRAVSLPFTDCCCPIINNKIHFETIYNTVIETGEKLGWKYVEIRGGKSLAHLLQAPPYATFYIHTLSIHSNLRTIVNNFRDSTRRNINKAANIGVRTDIHYSALATEEFYKLNCLTRRTHGLPPQPHAFFKAIYDHIISKKLGFIILAKLNDKPIAGAVFFLFGKKLIFKYGASDKKYHILRANNLVIFKAIEWCSQNGFENFCMGRTEIDNLGLCQFKDGWGTTRELISYLRYNVPHRYYEVRTSHKIDSLYKTAKALPISILKVLGNLAYRYVG